MAHGHHSDASEPAAAASWMVAMVLFVVLAIALVVALFAWAPWDDNNVGGGGGTTNEQQGEGDSDVNIDGNIDVTDGDQPAPSGQ